MKKITSLIGVNFQRIFTPFKVEKKSIFCGGIFSLPNVVFVRDSDARSQIDNKVGDSKSQTIYIHDNNHYHIIISTISPNYQIRNVLMGIRV